MRFSTPTVIRINLRESRILNPIITVVDMAVQVVQLAYQNSIVYQYLSDIASTLGRPSFIVDNMPWSFGHDPDDDPHTSASVEELDDEAESDSGEMTEES
jgi:hypothetical protein